MSWHLKIEWPTEDKPLVSAYKFTTLAFDEFRIRTLYSLSLDTIQSQFIRRQTAYQLCWNYRFGINTVSLSLYV